MFRTFFRLIAPLLLIHAVLVTVGVSTASARPAGEWEIIAYTVQGERGGVYFRDLARSLDMRFARDGTGIFQVSWSPDGRQLAYVAYARDGLEAQRVDVRALDIATGRTHNLTASLLPSLTYDWPVWSPDGARIAFYAHLPGEFQGINVVNLADGNVKNIVRGNSQPGSITWSPDGHSIAYVARSDSNIYRIDLETGQRHKLTNHYGMSVKYRLAWWGDKIAYIRDGHAIGHFRISVLDITSGRQAGVGPEHRFMRDLWWSSDGQRILFSSTSAERQPSLAFYEFRLTGGGLRRVTKLGTYIAPAFRPK
jgi:Tol biopolymer transport system component